MADIELVKQAKDLYSSLNNRQIIVIGSVVGLVLISFMFILFTSTSPDLGTLYNHLDQKDAAQIVEKLKEKNIEYDLEEGGTKILIDKEHLHETRLSLAAEGLPENSVVGYEIFDKTNLGMSEFVQKLNYKRAMEGELTRTISSLNEVVKSRVHIVIPDKALFEKDQKEPTASVTLTLKNGHSLDKISIKGIQNLVASSVEAMKVDNVTVVDARGKVLSQAPLDESTIAGMTFKQHAQQQKVESYISSKVQSLLDGVLGAGNSEVRVNAELDFTQIERTKTDFDPERQVERSTQIIAETSQTADSLSYPYVNMNKDQQNQITNYEISKNVEHIIEGVGNIKRLSVATLINGKTKVVETDGVQELTYIPRTEDEMGKLTEIVKNAVGYDPSRNDQVSVLNVPFDTVIDDEDLTRYFTKPWYQQPEYQKFMLLGALMLLTIIVLFSILRSKQVKNRLRIAFGLPEQIEADEEEEEGEELEEISFDDEELLLLPADLPEQMLLDAGESEMQHALPGETELEEAEAFADSDLAAQAKADLQEAPELTEEALMKLEIKEKVETYVEEETDEAVKLIRILLSQDINEFKF